MSAGGKSPVSKDKSSGPKRPRSVVWYYFEKMPNEHQRARCKICNSLCHHANNTSNLFKHLRVKHPATYKEAEAQKDAEMDLYLEMKSKIGKLATRPGIRGRRPKSYTQAIVKSETDASPSASMATNFVPNLTPSSHSSTGRKSYAMEKVRQSLNRSLVNMIASELIPLSTVESPGFRHFVRVLDSRYELPSKRSISKTMLPELAEETKNKIKLEVVIASYFALTLEAWVYRETQQYLTLTAHFVKDSWEMVSVSLESFDITEENTSDAVAMNLKRITDEWGISERIITLVTDPEIKDNVISTAALSIGWEHLSCFGQMLNNVILTSLKSVAEIARIQKKTSEAVTYFEKSVKASDTLAAVQQQHNLPVHKLKQEVETRWNSTFYMMERMVEQFEAVNTVLCFLGKDHMCLCDDEVELIRLVLDVLRPFEAATRELCTEPYASMSKVIPIATLLQQVIAASGIDTPGPQSALKSALLLQMQEQFANLETNYPLAVSTLLDPRFKRHAFTDSTALETAQQRLMSEIISTAAPLDAEGNGESNNSNDASNFWNMFDKKVSEAGAQKTTSSEADNECRRYFKEANIPRNSNPLQWWRLNQVQFPQLKVLAQKYLCIPATSVNSSLLFTRRSEFIHQRRDKVSLLIILTEQKPKHGPDNTTTTTTTNNTGVASTRTATTTTNNNAAINNVARAESLENVAPVLSITSCAGKLVSAVAKVISFGEKEGRESNNKEFSDQMLSACETLDLAKTNLYVTAQRFEVDQSPQAGQVVCQMAKDVLQAVVKVLLVVDTKQVNLILSLIAQTRKSLGVFSSVHLVEQLVPSFRGLTESVVQLKQRVDVRKNDLCSTSCRDQLSSSMNVLRKSIPSLSMAMQTFLKYQNNETAKASRDAVLKQIHGILDEIQYLIHTGASSSGGRQDEMAYCFVTMVDKIMECLSEDKRQELGEDFESLFVSLIQHCLTVANLHKGSYKDIIVTACHRILQAKFRLLDLHSMMVGSPNVTDIRVEYDNLCETILDEVCDLEKQVNMTLIHLIVETFIDTTIPLDRLVKAGLEYNNKQGRPFSEVHSDLIQSFSDYVDNICQIALLAAASSDDVTRSSAIQSSVQDLETLDPDIVPVVVTVSRQKSDTASIRHLRLLVKRWQLETGIIVKTVDKMIDVRVFLEVTEQKMSSKMKHVMSEIHNKPVLKSKVDKILAYALRAGQLGSRVVDGHTDPIYRNGLMVFVRKLTDAINLARAALNDVLTNPLSSKLSDTLDRRLKLLHGSVLGLRQGLDEKNHPNLMSPERGHPPGLPHTRDSRDDSRPDMTTRPKTRRSVTKLPKAMESKLSTTVPPNKNNTSTITQSRPGNAQGDEGSEGMVAGSTSMTAPAESVLGPEGKVQPKRSTGVGNTLSWPVDKQPVDETKTTMVKMGNDGGADDSNDVNVPETSGRSWLKQGQSNIEVKEELSNLELVINRLLTAATSGDRMSTDSLTSDILGWTNHIVDAGDSLLAHCGQIAQGQELKQLVRDIDTLVPAVIQCTKFLVSGDKDRRNELHDKSQEWSQKLNKARIIVDVASDKWLLLTHALTQAINTDDTEQGKTVLDSISQAQHEMSCLLLKARFLSGQWVEKGVDTIDYLTDCHKDIENLSVTISTSVQVADVYTSRTASERWQFAQVSRDWSVLMTCIVSEMDRMSDAMETLGREKFPRLRCKAAERESRLAGVLEEETNALLELVDCVVISDPSVKSRSEELVAELNEALSDVVAVARQPVVSSKIPNHTMFCRLRIGLARNRWIEKALQVRELIQNHCFEYSGSVRQILHAMLDFKETDPSGDALQKEQQRLINDLLELSGCIKQKSLACIQLSADLPRRAVLRSSLDIISTLTARLQDALKDPGLKESDVSYLSEMWGAHMKKLVCNLGKLEGVRPGVVAEIEKLTKAKSGINPVSMRSHLQHPSEEAMTMTTQHSNFLSPSSASPRQFTHRSIGGASSSLSPDVFMSPSSLSRSSCASPRVDIGTPLGKSVQVVLKNAEFLDAKLNHWSEEDFDESNDDEGDSGGGDGGGGGVANAFSSSNIVKQATAMTSLCSQMALFTKGEGPLKNSSEVIGAAVALTRHSSVLESFGRRLLAMIVDNRCKNNLNASISALNSLSSQLHIIATALHNSARSFEGERMLVRNASNLLLAVKALFAQVEISATQGVIEPGQALDPPTQSIMAFLTKIRTKHQRYLEAQMKNDGQLDELGLRRMELHDPPSLTSLIDI